MSCSVRTSADRWTSLSHLLAALERALEGAARLDAYDRPHDARVGTRLQTYLAFGDRLRAIETRIDSEVDRCTAELLDAQLAEKLSRDTRSVA